MANELTKGVRPAAVSLFTPGMDGTPATYVGSGSGFGGGAGAAFTRPNDTTGYTAGDVVSTTAGAVIEFANIGPAGGDIFLTLAELMIALAAVPSGMGNFRLHIYNAAPTAIADNAAYNLPAGDRAKYLGFIDLVTPEDLGDTLRSTNDIARHVKLADGATSLYGIIETRGAFTPAAETVYTPSLRSIAA